MNKSDVSQNVPAAPSGTKTSSLGLRDLVFAIPLWCAAFVVAYTIAFLALYPRVEFVQSAAAAFDGFIVRYERMLPVLNHATEVLSARDRADRIIPIRNVLFVMSAALLCAVVAYLITIRASIERLAAATIRRADAGEKMFRSEQPAIFGSLLFGYIAAAQIHSSLSTEDIFFRRRWKVYMYVVDVAMMNFVICFVMLACLFLSITAVFAFARADVRAALVRRRARMDASKG